MSIYIQIAEAVRREIVNGIIPVGTRLSQRVTALKFKVSRKPVSEAFELLEAEGLLSTKPQSGTIVINNIWKNLSRPQDSFWKFYTQSGRNKSFPLNMLTIFNKMEDSASVKIDSDKMASTFNPSSPLVNAMENVAKRLKCTEDLGTFCRNGLYTLRKTLCKHMQRYGINASEDEIVITSGIGESLYLICGASIGSNINFFHETPSFINSTMLVQSTGCNIHPVAMDSEGINAIELNIKLRHTKNAILYTQLVNHIPTGTHTTKKRRNQILSICGKFKVPIVENDMFRDFYFDKIFPRPLKAFDRNEQIIYIGTLLNGFMGYKQSWIFAPRFIIERIKDLNTHIELVPNIFGQMFAEEMLSSGYYYEYLDNIRPHMIKHYHKVQYFLKKYLADIAGWREDYPSFYIWLRLEEKLKILECFARSKEFLFYPGAMFESKDKRHIRLNIFAVNTEDLEEWIKMISNLLRSYNK